MIKDNTMKFFALAIAMSFITVTLAGVSGLAQQEDIIPTREGIPAPENMSLYLDAELIKKVENIRPEIDNQVNSITPIETDSTVFTDGFESYGVWALPTDPPWTTQIETGTPPVSFVDDFEDDTLASTPDNPPWASATGAIDTVFFYDDFEDDTIGSAPNGAVTPAGAPWDYLTQNGDCSITVQASPGGGGAPPGAQSLYFDEGADGDAYSYVGTGNFGPGPADQTVLIELTWNTGGDAANSDCTWYIYDSLGTLTMVFYTMYSNGVNSDFVYFDGTSGFLSGNTVGNGAWRDVVVEYDPVGNQYWYTLDGGAQQGPYGVDPAAGTADTVGLSESIFFGGDDATTPFSSQIYIDELKHYIPASGGTEVIMVTNTWANSGTQSVLLDQNNEAISAVTATSFARPYYGSVVAMSWYAYTDATAGNSDGSVFNIYDQAGDVFMGIRFNGGNIEYYTAGAWSILQAYTASTEYFIEVDHDSLGWPIPTYGAIRINSVSYAAGAPLGIDSSGIGGFELLGTPGTPATIMFDNYTISSPGVNAYIFVDDTLAHSGTQSLRMMEMGADTYSYFSTNLNGTGLGVGYGEFWFWFYAYPGMGQGQVYMYDSAGTSLVTIFSMGADIGGGSTPGAMQWVDGDGTGLGTIQGGPTYTTGTWNNVSIRYNIVAGTIEPFWNGVSEGVMGVLESAATDFCIPVIFGDAPDSPQNYAYDDFGLWVDDPPAPPTDVNVIGLNPISNTYHTAADNAVEGTVAGTYADTNGGGVQTVTEILGAPGTNNMEAFPTADTALGTAWLTPTDGYSNADAGATTSADANGMYHSWHGYDFSGIAGGATIEGIEVTLYGANSNRNGNSVDVALSWDSGTSWTASVNQVLPRNAPTDFILGGPADDWGHIPWSLAEVQGGLRVSMLYNQADRVGEVDAIGVTVYYSTPAAYSLEHIWTTDSLGAAPTTLDLYVTGYHNTGSDDTFSIGYATALGGPYTSVITINSDASQEYTSALPTAIATGVPIYLNVIDDNAADNTNADTVTIDEIRIEWSFVPGGSDIIVQWTLSADDGAGANDVAGYNVYYSDEGIGESFFSPKNFLGTVGAGVSQYSHVGEAADLVNMTWYQVTAVDAYGTESDLSGNASKFNIAPATQNLLVDGLTEITVAPGAIVTLTATMYDDTSTWEDIPKMDGAEWYDSFVGDPGEGLGTAMTDDGLWNDTSEAVSGTVDTTGWGSGESHWILVRGHESGPGNTGTGWSAGTGVWINTTSANPYDIPIPGGAGAGNWVFVSFPYVMSGPIETVLDDSVYGGGGTTWDVAKWYDPLNITDPWKTHRIGASTNDLTTISNLMGVWLHLLTHDGGTLTTGTTGDYAAGNVDILLYTGWNLVSYPSATSRVASTTLPGVADNMAYYDAAAPYLIIDDPALATTLVEGNAYWVRVTADVLWQVGS